MSTTGKESDIQMETLETSVHHHNKSVKLIHNILIIVHTKLSKLLPKLPVYYQSGLQSTPYQRRN